MLKNLLLINLLFAFMACNAMELPEKNNNNGKELIAPTEKQYNFVEDLPQNMWQEIIEQIIKTSPNIPESLRNLSSFMLSCKKLQTYVNEFGKKEIEDWYIAILKKILAALPGEQEIPFSCDLNQIKSKLRMDGNIITKFKQVASAINSKLELRDVVAYMLKNDLEELAILTAENTIPFPNEFCENGVSHGILLESLNGRKYRAIFRFANRALDKIDYQLSKWNSKNYLEKLSMISEIAYDDLNTRPSESISMWYFLSSDKDSMPNDAKECFAKLEKRVFVLISNIVDKLFYLPLKDIKNKDVFSKIFHVLGQIDLVHGSLYKFDPGYLNNFGKNPEEIWAQFSKKDQLIFEFIKTVLLNPELNIRQEEDLERIYFECQNL